MDDHLYVDIEEEEMIIEPEQQEEQEDQQLGQEWKQFFRYENTDRTVHIIKIGPIVYPYPNLYPYPLKKWVSIYICHLYDEWIEVFIFLTCNSFRFSSELCEIGL